VLALGLLYVLFLLLLAMVGPGEMAAPLRVEPPAPPEDSERPQNVVDFIGGRK
jgi:hypothetical protein